MKKLILLILLLLTGMANAVPDWFSNIPNDEFPQDMYFRDIGVSDKDFDSAKKKAVSSIAKQIESYVKAKSISKRTSVKWNSREDIKEEYSDNSMIFSAIDLKNAEISKQEKENGKYFVLVTIDKAQLAQTLRNEIKTINNSISSSIKSAKENFSKKRINDAVEDLLSVNSLIWDGEEKVNLLGHIVKLSDEDKIVVDTKDVANLLKNYLSEIKIEKISGDKQEALIGKSLDPFKIRVSDKYDNPLKNISILVDKGLDETALVYTNSDGEASYSVRAIDTDGKDKYITLKIVFPFPQKIMRKIEDNLETDFSYRSIAGEKVKYKVDFIPTLSRKNMQSLSKKFEDQLSKVGVEYAKKSSKKIKVEIKKEKLVDIVSMTRLVQYKLVATITVLKGKKEKGKIEVSSVGIGSDDDKAIESAILGLKIDLDKMATILGTIKINDNLSSVAIVNFKEFSIFYPNIGNSFAEMLITAFYESGEYDVVESEKLKNIIDELQLSSTGLINSDKLKEVGNMASADYIITGKISGVGDGIEIDARMINVETRKIEHVASIKINSIRNLRYAANKIVEKLIN